MATVDFWKGHRVDAFVEGDESCESFVAVGWTSIPNLRIVEAAQWCWIFRMKSLNERFKVLGAFFRFCKVANGMAKALFLVCQTHVRARHASKTSRDRSFHFQIGSKSKLGSGLPPTFPSRSN